MTSADLQFNIFQRQINRAGNMTCPSMLLGDHGTLPGVRLLQFLSMESLDFEFLSDGLYSCIYNYWLKRQPLHCICKHIVVLAMKNLVAHVC